MCVFLLHIGGGENIYIIIFFIEYLRLKVNTSNTDPIDPRKNQHKINTAITSPYTKTVK